jgi:hypothetical protein
MTSRTFFPEVAVYCSAKQTSAIGPSQNGFETLCTTAAKLIQDLSNASQKGLREERWEVLAQVSLYRNQEAQCLVAM